MLVLLCSFFSTSSICPKPLVLSFSLRLTVGFAFFVSHSRRFLVGHLSPHASGGVGSRGGGDGTPSSGQANSISRAYSVLER